MTTAQAPPRGWGALALATLAVLWGAALVVGAFVYPWETEATGGLIDRVGQDRPEKASTTETLAEAEGVDIALIASLPGLIGAILVWVALHRRCTRGETWTDGLAWGVIGLLFLFSFLGAASVGFWVTPSVMLLGAAAALTPAARPLA